MSSYPSIRNTSVTVDGNEYNLNEWYSRDELGKAIKNRIKFAAVEIENNYGQLKKYNVLLDSEIIGYVESFGSTAGSAWNGKRTGQSAGWEYSASQVHEITVKPYGKTETHTSTARSKSHANRSTRKTAAIELITDEIRVGNITL